MKTIKKILKVLFPFGTNGVVFPLLFCLTIIFTVIGVFTYGGAYVYTGIAVGVYLFINLIKNG